MIAFRDRETARHGLDLIVHVNEEGVRRGIGPISHGSRLHTDVMKTEALKQAPDTVNILESTRSFTTNWFSRFLYANMSYHIEHHCYPMVPFHALPKLNAALRDQLPPPDRGLLRTNGLVFAAAWRRTFGGLRAVD